MDPLTLFIVILFVVVLVLAFLLIKKPSQAAPDFTLQNEHIRTEERLAAAEQNNQTLKQENDQLRQSLSREQLANARAEEAFMAQKKKVAGLEQASERFNKDFELIANRILEEKTQKFTETNRGNMDVILNPLKENIKNFQEKVESVYKAESDERNVLKGEISKLVELNKQISEEAHNLSSALRRDTKKQGNWGEVILDRLLEASGLTEGESYTKQASFTDENGGRQLPDVLVHLPEEKNIIIDSKISLTAYEKLMNAESEDERATYLKAHLHSVRAHITGLGAKNYPDIYGIGSPDFVLMFLPIESSFAVAVQYDAELFDFAWKKRVVMVSPSTLLATLKTVAGIWKVEKQNRNAFEIAREAGLLYDKFTGFLKDLENVGRHLAIATKAHEDAFKALRYERGNIIGKTEKLRILGAKNSKAIDPKYLDDSE
ncbi:MAG: DNA recombination protein RmuC [Mucilaginibacter polytrichastri]|nr:DNA recombination protein RmuC [Mucilaginibacter polytrichastri]